MVRLHRLEFIEQQSNRWRVIVLLVVRTASIRFEIFERQMLLTAALFLDVASNQAPETSFPETTETQNRFKPFSSIPSRFVKCKNQSHTSPLNIFQI
jgi:hypothetical protein